MVDFPKPEVICTHESDLDGLISGLLLQRLALKLFGEEPRLEAYHNHNWRQRALPEKSAWVCDLAFEPRLDRSAGHELFFVASQTIRSGRITRAREKGHGGPRATRHELCVKGPGAAARGA